MLCPEFSFFVRPFVLFGKLLVLGVVFHEVTYPELASTALMQRAHGMLFMSHAKLTRWRFFDTFVVVAVINIIRF